MVDADLNSIPCICKCSCEAGNHLLSIMKSSSSPKAKAANRVILVPYPAQGHVTPMLQLGAALVSLGFNPVLITPDYIHRGLIINSSETAAGISYLGIPDGLEADAPRDFFTIEAAMESVMPIQLERILQRDLDNYYDSKEVGFMVVDVLASWAIQVGNRCGIPTVGFWPAMLATYRVVASIPDLIRTGIVSHSGIPHTSEGKLPSLFNNQPLLTTPDLPWLIGSTASKKARFRFWTRAVDRCRCLPWILVNSFHDDQLELINHKPPLIKNNTQVTNYPLVVPIGPLSMMVAAASMTTKSPSFWQEDRSCLDWLQDQKPNSVIYISFGSWVGPIKEESVNKLAVSLEASGLPFLWALSSSWRGGLPVGLTERALSRGKVVSWAPQTEILQNKAVGCYLTHCGWNSTMEAIQYQKKLLCYPVAGDQFVNCKYIVEVWRIGVRLCGFGEREVADGVDKVMNDKEMGERVKGLCERTMGKTASLKVEQNLTVFIDDMHMHAEINRA